MRDGTGAGPGGRRRSCWEGLTGSRLREHTTRTRASRRDARRAAVDLEGWCAASSPLGTAAAHGLPRPRLAEKKASIGYTYEDSTVAEVEKVAEKPEEEESPAEEESNSDEDEVIPDIGGVPSLPSPPPQSLGIVFVSRPSPSVGCLVLMSPVSPSPAPGPASPCCPPCLTMCSRSLALSFLVSRTPLYETVPT